MLRIGALLIVLLFLSGCGPREPLRIGFIGGLSGRVTDLGEAGRNGAQIAIEEINRAGGVKGRRVELIVRDDAQSPEKAIAAVNELIAARVAAIIGPMTSAMTEVVLPLAERAGVVLVSPTVTAHNFFGVDDVLFLIMSSTRAEAESSAEYHFTESAVRHVAAIHDARNRAYTESWLRDFTVGFQARGGDVVPIAFESGPDLDSSAIVRKALAQRRYQVRQQIGAQSGEHAEMDLARFGSDHLFQFRVEILAVEGGRANHYQHQKSHQRLQQG